MAHYRCDPGSDPIFPWCRGSRQRDTMDERAVRTLTLSSQPLLGGVAGTAVSHHSGARLYQTAHCSEPVQVGPPAHACTEAEQRQHMPTTECLIRSLSGSV
ncbi:unnamed protein product [Boreogadus saida]